MIKPNNNRNSWPHISIARIALISFILLAAWIGSGFIIWKQCKIPLPDGSGSVVYMARLNKIPSAEWDRKVRIETNRFHSRDRWLPNDPSGAWPVNVYWYAAKDDGGPYLRFKDPMWEYLVDLKHGATLYVVRDENGNAHVGEILTSRSLGKFDVSTVAGHPTHNLMGKVASENGTYLGRIEYPFNHFTPGKEEPEQPLPEH